MSGYNMFAKSFHLFKNFKKNDSAVHKHIDKADT